MRRFLVAAVRSGSDHKYILLFESVTKESVTFDINHDVPPRRARSFQVQPRQRNVVNADAKPCFAHFFPVTILALLKLNRMPYITVHTTGSTCYRFVFAFFEKKNYSSRSEQRNRTNHLRSIAMTTGTMYVKCPLHIVPILHAGPADLTTINFCAFSFRSFSVIFFASASRSYAIY